MIAEGGPGRVVEWSGLPPSQSYGPGMSGAMSGQGVPANTFPPTGNGVMRAPRVPTDVGVTRETSAPGQPATGTSRAPLIIAFAVVVLLCGVGGVVAVRRSAVGTAPPTHDTGMDSVVRGSDHPLPAAPSPLAPPTAVLAPLASATALPSASASASASTPAASLPPVVPQSASSKAYVPQNLNGVQPHF